MIILIYCVSIITQSGFQASKATGWLLQSYSVVLSASCPRSRVTMIHSDEG